MKSFLLTLVFSLLVSPLMADEGERIPPPKDPTYLKECGGCHLAFPPQMLPSRSWEKILVGLADHFGENAALAPDVVKGLGDFLAREAGDKSKRGGRMLRDLPSRDTPLRISETPYWRHEHSEREAKNMFTAKKVGSWADCVACHTGAEKGDYEL